MQVNNKLQKQKQMSAFTSLELIEELGRRMCVAFIPFQLEVPRLEAAMAEQNGALADNLAMAYAENIGKEIVYSGGVSCWEMPHPDLSKRVFLMRTMIATPVLELSSPPSMTDPNTPAEDLMVNLRKRILAHQEAMKNQMALKNFPAKGNA
jgi:hypothetical protein